MKQKVQKQKCQNLDLWIILGVITFLAIVTAVLLAVKPFTVKTFDKIEHLTVENFKTKDGNKANYFVLLYDSKEDNKMLEECVLDYVEYARTHDEAPKLYVIDYREYPAITNSDNFNISSLNLETQVPCLGTVSTSGSLSVGQKSVSDICNLLEDYMIGKK